MSAYIKGFVIKFFVPTEVSLAPLVAPNGPYTKPSKTDPMAKRMIGENVVKIDRPQVDGKPGEAVMVLIHPRNAGELIPPDDVTMLIETVLHDFNEAGLF